MRGSRERFPRAEDPLLAPEILAAAFARYRPLIDDWAAFIAALRRPLPVCVWANTLRAGVDEVRAALEEDGMSPMPLSWNRSAFRLPAGTKFGQSWPHLAGLIHVQEEVSMLPARLLGAGPGERVLDLCACPGNKTAQLAVAMENRGSVVANDVRIDRTRALRNVIVRLGLTNVSTTVQDGKSFPNGAGTFDRVLVDAPCSCEGTTRKNPGIIREVHAGGFRVNVRTQKELLRRAVRLCKPGGRIVYSTCTYAPEENEVVVDDLLREVEPGVLRLAPATVAGFVGSAGVTAWEGRELLPELANTLRVWPHQNDSGGFFVAVIEKIREEASVTKRRHRVLADGALPPLEPADRHDVERSLAYFEDRFGVPRTVFGAAKLFRGRKRGFYVVAADHRPPRVPKVDASGFFAFQTTLVFPKPSTTLVASFGRRARKNIVELDRAQLDGFTRRTDTRLGPDQCRSVESQGYVIARYRGFPIGVGLLRLPEGGGVEKGGVLESWFPKALATR